MMEELTCYYNQQEYCQSKRQKNVRETSPTGEGRGQKDKVEKGGTSNNQKVMQGKSVPFQELPLLPPANCHLPSSQLHTNSPLIYANSNFQNIDKIRAVVVEDQELIVIGIKKALEQYENIEIIGDAFNAKHGLTLLNKLKPKIAIIDICLPDCDGIQLTREIRRKHPGVKVIILTSHSDRETVLKAFAAGATSYCMKDIKFAKLIEAIYLTCLGYNWIDPAVTHFVLQQAQKNPICFNRDGSKSYDDLDEEMLDLYTLTGRELQILDLIVNGNTNAAIANQLHITIGTVKSHVRNILNKIGAEDRTQAAVHALRYGLVD